MIRRTFGAVVLALSLCFLASQVALAAYGEDDQETIREIRLAHRVCYVWIGKEMAFGIRPFTTLGCWLTLPATEPTQNKESNDGLVFTTT